MSTERVAIVVVLILCAGAFALWGLVQDYQAQRARNLGDGIARPADTLSVPTALPGSTDRLIQAGTTSTGLLVVGGFTGDRPITHEWTNQEGKVVLTVHTDGRVDWHGDQSAAALAFWKSVEHMGTIRRSVEGK